MSEPHGERKPDAAPQPEPAAPGSPGLTSLQKYNVVTDLGSGVNVRWRDNLIQLIAVVLGLAVGAGVGAAVSFSLAGALLGGIAGLIVGLLGSGIYLMIYRAIAHARGKHD
jgi:hypothetical protein